MILIVDDKPENLFSLRKTLEANLFEVDTALSGEEALRKILRKDYTLIILDVQMPDMDGFEVAEALEGYGKAKDIPIIFLSAVNTDKRFITKGYATGAMDYLVKPVDPDILVLKVRTFCMLSERTNALKKAEIQLTQTNQQLLSTLESLPQIAFTALQSGKIEFVNSFWFDFSTDKNIFPATHNGDKEISKMINTGMVLKKQFENEVLIKNIHTNEYRHHLLRMVPTKNDHNPMRWVGTFTDIHEQKMGSVVLEEKVQQRTKELQQKNKELDESNLELQQFAAVASHDLKEPLRKMQIFSDMLLRQELDGENEQLKSYLGKIVHSSDRMTTLINDLLSYSRLSVQEIFQQVDLNTILHEVLSDLEMAITEKHAIIESDTLPTIQAVPGQMRQLFQNIISNSIKFSKIDISPRINIAVQKVTQTPDGGELPETETPYWQITISDEGIGFDEKYLDRIFTIFQRLNPRETYEGTGIGLAITKKIVDRHNGYITAKSKETRGASFIIILPQEQTINS